MSEVDKLLADQRKALLAKDGAMLQMMADRWGGVQRALAGNFELLAQDIMAAGIKSTQPWRITELGRYQTLMTQVKEQIALYSSSVSRDIAGYQSQFTQLGLFDTGQVFDVAGMTQFNRLPVNAVNTMIGLAQDGSPLQKILSATHIDAVDGIMKELINGIALGLNPKEMARRMANGAAGSLNRMMTIARTEALRSYRDATFQQYAATGVQQWQRVEAKDSRTCPGCLALDGRLYPMNRKPFDHPRGRMTLIPVLKGLDKRPSAESWFYSQPIDKQKAQLGAARWDGLTKGLFNWGDMAKVTNDPVWGDSVTVRSLTELGV
jgi:SPP1 gp7 family putative phage head morphogenesis protein